MSTMEHSEHISHAGHSHDGHGGHGASFGMRVGITMALLGVLLAFSAAKVGGERAELVKSLVEQQNAHAKYQGNDVKHRVAAIALFQVHAEVAGASKGKSLNKEDVGFLAQNVERYLQESAAAKTWVESYDPLIEVHVEAQEYYEFGQLSAEVAIVVASVALLLRRKEAWFVAVGLGILSIAIVIATFVHSSHIAHASEQKIEENFKAYREMRNAHKTTQVEQKVVDEMLAWSGRPHLAKLESERHPESPGAKPDHK
ncbi:MAG TPA: DUF4337 family protein [Leptospiraceae bacterium]|nr:DUF4337 family protein [Leptospiraceae bacterium]HNJ35689.1 DUF4337 family protein [Leptospiraceae bacterium]